MKLYVIRHGQSEANAKGFHSGQLQVPLTERGEADARRAGELISGIAYDKVYASDLLRAVQTARIALPDATPELSPLIRELDVGPLLEGKYVSECRAEYGDDYEGCRAKTDYRLYGGESLSDLSVRVLRFVDLLRERGDGTVIAFAHAGVVSTLLSAAVGADPASRGINLCENGSVNLFEIRERSIELLKWSYTGSL